MWPYIKEIEELNQYFADFKLDELSEREFLWTIILIFRPEATKKIIEDVRKNRSIKSEENKEELVRLIMRFSRD